MVEGGLDLILHVLQGKGGTGSTSESLELQNAATTSKFVKAHLQSHVEEACSFLMGQCHHQWKTDFICFQTPSWPSPAGLFQGRKEAPLRAGHSECIYLRGFSPGLQQDWLQS